MKTAALWEALIVLEHAGNIDVRQRKEKHFAKKLNKVKELRNLNYILKSWTSSLMK